MGASVAQSSSISLTSEQQALVDELVRTGRFAGANDVVATGLRLLEDRENQAAAFVSALEDEVELGLRSGEAAPMEPASKLLASFRART
ncbi:type II toxin-antitoxin system ParD family antitoxin [Rhizobium sp. Rhizsp82]|uniref:type II toxin-antitoxin system ParD family antitoxin n=1 Tax=Rhizobium sp. Rhizsp82 TaxID=3243057 RepID=UPI0039B6D196